MCIEVVLSSGTRLRIWHSDISAALWAVVAAAVMISGLPIDGIGMAVVDLDLSVLKPTKKPAVRAELIKLKGKPSKGKVSPPNLGK